MKKLFLWSLFILMICASSVNAQSLQYNYWRLPTDIRLSYSSAHAIYQNKRAIAINGKAIAIHDQNIVNITDNINSNQLSIMANTDALNSLQQTIVEMPLQINSIQQEIETLDNSGINIFANGNLIGKSIDINGNILLEFNPFFEPIRIWANGKFKDDSDWLIFKQPDCVGEIYVSASAIYDCPFYPPFKTRPIKGKVFSCHNSAICEYPLYYYKQYEENAYKFIPISRYTNGICTNFPSSYIYESYYFKLSPNNPLITGIQSYPFLEPITFEGYNMINVIDE